MRRYRGESNAKKMHRIILWQLMLRETAGHPRRIHVLASREAGDISCLLALGVRPEEIHAYEKDVEAHEIASTRFPTVHWGSNILNDMQPEYVLLGFRTSAAEKPPGARLEEGDLCDLVYLDLCSPLGIKSLELILLIARRMHNFADRDSCRWTAPARLAVTFLKGREFRNAPRCIGVNKEVKGNSGDPRTLRRDSRHVWRNRLSALLAGTTGSYDELFRYVRQEYPDVPTAVLRIGILTEALRLHGLRGWHPTALMEYSSGRSPMQTVVFEKWRDGGYESYTCFGDFILRHSFAHDDVVWRGDCEHRGPYPPEYDVVVPREAPSWEEAKRLAVEERDVPWAALLNVSPGTVAAWRAVATKREQEKGLWRTRVPIQPARPIVSGTGREQCQPPRLLFAPGTKRGSSTPWNHCGR